jgi:LCP family protein required for cell wall assembly
MSGNGQEDLPGEQPQQRPRQEEPQPTDEEPQPKEERPSRRRSTGWKVAGWAAAAVALLVVAASLTAYFRYRSVWSSIQRVQIVGLGSRPPQYNTNALNVLLIGSDSRAGANRKFGATVEGQRSDTIMIMHISPGHRDATVLSIPRDSMVPILACPADGPGVPGQQAEPGVNERINATFANGGPSCLWKTVEHETGIHIDHFIELAFSGFEHIVNDIGGVNICLPVAINDPDSGLHLSAGMHHVMGPQALAFWRERHIGTGSDLQRIQRDQYLMASLLQGLRQSDILGSPTKIYSIVVDAAGAMTTDAGLNLSTMVRIADSLKGLSSNSVQFVQVPEIPYPGDPGAEVMFEQPQANRLFRAIAHDTTVPQATSGSQAVRRRAPASGSASTPAPTPSASPPVSGLSKSYGGIKGSAQACHDQSAFTGGDQPGNFPNPL